VIGAGSIGQAIARRVSTGKHVLLADLKAERQMGTGKLITRELGGPALRLPPASRNHKNLTIGNLRALRIHLSPLVRKPSRGG
jgi:hypothetical protein